MTEFEQKMLDEAKKQTAQLSMIKSIAFVIFVFVAIGIGAQFAL